MYVGAGVDLGVRLGEGAGVGECFGLLVGCDDVDVGVGVCDCGGDVVASISAGASGDGVGVGADIVAYTSATDDPGGGVVASAGTGYTGSGVDACAGVRSAFGSVVSVLLIYLLMNMVTYLQMYK